MRGNPNTPYYAELFACFLLWCDAQQLDASHDQLGYFTDPFTEARWWPFSAGFSYGHADH